MNVTELRDQLLSLGIDIVAEGGQLRVGAARGKLTENIQKAIAAHRAELLELLSNLSGQRPSDLVRVPRNDALQLSFFQERLWVLHRLTPDSTDYNMVVVWPGGQSANAAYLADRIRGTVLRHEILRSTFGEIDGAPCVRILSEEAVRIEVKYLNDLDEKQQRKLISAAIDAAAHTPFDLATEAPVRFTVYQNDSGPTLCRSQVTTSLWTCGHWRCSGTKSYPKTSVPRLPPRVATPQLQYIDFAAWQRRNFDPKSIESQLVWWERRLAGIPQLCVFPPDSVPAPRNAGLARSFAWSTELLEAVRELARAEGATLYMALLAACSVVLQAHTGQNDIVLGSPMGVRERPEFETMIGPFINLLVLRIDLADDPTFAELLRIGRDAVLDAHAHREVPFELLVERLMPARNFNHHPLFQVAVVLHNASGESSEPIHSGGAMHDLTWFAREVDGRFENTIEFRSDLYTAEAIDRIAGHLEAVLHAAVVDRHRRISEISLLTAQEREKVIVQFNATAREVDQETFVAQFERQVALSAKSRAISFEGAELSYDALNRTCQPACATPAISGDRPGRTRWTMPRPDAGSSCRIAGHPEDGCSLCTARSIPPGRTLGIYVVRQRHGDAGDCGQDSGRVGDSGKRASARPCRRSFVIRSVGSDRSGGGCGAERRRLRHLHIRFAWAAKGRGHLAWRTRELPGLDEA